MCCTHTRTARRVTARPCVRGRAHARTSTCTLTLTLTRTQAQRTGGWLASPQEAGCGHRAPLDMHMSCVCHTGSQEPQIPQTHHLYFNGFGAYR